MKPKTPELLKFKRLSRRIGEGVRGTVGLLELLWVGTSKNCPEGDVGRFSNEEIAVMCDWSGDADELVAALLETRWLDACPEYRLVVHDWHEHAPNYVKGNLKSRAKPFARQPANSDPPSETPGDPPEHPATFPFPTLPSPPPPEADPAWEEVVVELHDEGMGRAQTACRTARTNGCDPGAVRMLLEHFRSKKPAWEPGALYARILELRPGQDISSLWPPPSKAVQQNQQSIQRHAQQAELEKRRASEAEAKAASDAKWKALWKKHRAAIEAMTDAEIKRVVTAHSPTEAGLILKGGVKRPIRGLLQTTLLERLESLEVANV